jgi:hypothetical protein
MAVNAEHIMTGRSHSTYRCEEKNYFEMTTFPFQHCRIEEKKKRPPKKEKKGKSVTPGSYFFSLFAHGANVDDGNGVCLNSSINTRVNAVAYEAVLRSSTCKVKASIRRKMRALKHVVTS